MTNLQQKKIHGLKPKIYELTKTKIMFKPIYYDNIHINKPYKMSECALCGTVSEVINIFVLGSSINYLLNLLKGDPLFPIASVKP
jgi:hypothetical protein